MQNNRYELKLVIEELKARELRAEDPADLAEIRNQKATWEAMYKAAGGDPSRVRPASLGNDLRMALSKAGFPALDPDRYMDGENAIAQVREYQVAASDMPFDREVLVRREANLEASLQARKKCDRLSAIGIGMAHLSWAGAVPAIMLAGTSGAIGCVGLLFGGLALHLTAEELQKRATSKFIQNTPPGDVMTIAKWQQDGPRLVEEFTRRQAERFNAKWMEKAIQPDPSGIVTTQDAIMVGGVRLKTRRG